MRYSASVAIAALALFQPAHAGITIHFKGSAADAPAAIRITERACALAQLNQWPCSQLSGEEIRRTDGITAKFITEIEKSSDLSGA